MKKKSLIEVKNLKKRFGKVTALKGINLTVTEGEIVGLIGDNGAGKTTLLNILGGKLSPTEGEIYLEGKKVRFSSPLEARLAGIETVHQKYGFVEKMSIYRNFFLGRELKKHNFLQIKKMKDESFKMLKELGIVFRSVDDPISVLSGGEKQLVNIGRAFYFEAKLLLLDEPTTALGVEEVDRFLSLVKKAKRKGISSIYVSHNIYHVYDVVDNFVVLDRGRKVASFSRDEYSPEKIVAVLKKISIEST